LAHSLSSSVFQYRREYLRLLPGCYVITPSVLYCSPVTYWPIFSPGTIQGVCK
jgi:hypothetical protein